MVHLQGGKKASELSVEKEIFKTTKEFFHKKYIVIKRLYQMDPYAVMFIEKYRVGNSKMQGKEKTQRQGIIIQ